MNQILKCGMYQGNEFVCMIDMENGGCELMSEKLKPCPHCGCSRIAMITYHEINTALRKGGECTVIECEHCHAGVKRWREEHMESRNSAIAAWNRRDEK